MACFSDPPTHVYNAKLPTDSWADKLIECVEENREDEVKHNVMGSITNNAKTKVLIISRSKDIGVDIDYVNELKKRSNTKNMRFNFYCETEHDQAPKNETTFFNKFIKFGPTVVVFTYKHGIELDEVVEWKYDISTLRSNPIFYKVLMENYISKDSKPFCKSNFLIAETRNIWHLEDCIFTSLGRQNAMGFKAEMIKAKDKFGLKNKDTTRVLIISGGHGWPYVNGEKESCGGKSSYTLPGLQSYQQYKDDCKTVGIASQSRHEEPSLKKRENEEPDSLMMHEDFNKMRFNVLNIAYYADINGPKIDKLVKWLVDYRPTFIVINWCFAMNGDLAMDLRQQGWISRLLMEHDLRKISGKDDSKLSPQQIEILDEAGKGMYKFYHLVGSSGCGKTVMGLGIAKTMLAQVRRTAKLIQFLVLIQGNNDRNPTILKRKLQDYVKDLAHLATASGDDDEIPVEIIPFNKDIKNLNLVIKTKVMENREKYGSTHSIVFVDEIWIDPEKRKIDESSEESTATYELVQEINKFDPTDLPENVYCVYAYNPIIVRRDHLIFAHIHKVEGAATASATDGSFRYCCRNMTSFITDLPKIDSERGIYSARLNVKYRHCKEIMKFLEFWATIGPIQSPMPEWLVTRLRWALVNESHPIKRTPDLNKNVFKDKEYCNAFENILLDGDKDETGDYLPEKLDNASENKKTNTPHPIIWLDCDWDWNKKQVKKFTKENVSKLDTKLTFLDQEDLNQGVLLVDDRTSPEDQEGNSMDEQAGASTNNQRWEWVKKYQCAGLEEDIVILIASELLNYEVLSRARKQLIIISGTELNYIQKFFSRKECSVKMGLVHRIEVPTYKGVDITEKIGEEDKSYMEEKGLSALE